MQRVTETSRAAYRAGGPRSWLREMVYGQVLFAGPAGICIADITANLRRLAHRDVDKSSVSARLNELKAAGRIEPAVPFRGPSQATGILAGHWRAAEPGPARQMSLF
jgi:hypothetical protein